MLKLKITKSLSESEEAAIDAAEQDIHYEYRKYKKLREISSMAGAAVGGGADGQRCHASGEGSAGERSSAAGAGRHSLGQASGGRGECRTRPGRLINEVMRLAYLGK